MTKNRASKLRKATERRILVLDGATGTAVQARNLSEADFRGERFIKNRVDLAGNNDVLSLTRPDVVRDIHKAYLAAGADIVETNTFTATSISQADYGLPEIAREINLRAAMIAKEATAEAEGEDPTKPRFVAGVVGPTNKTASISPEVDDPAFRDVTFEDLRLSYGEAVAGLLDGGVDILMVETVFDTLNAKAALFAIDEVFERRGDRVPIMISGTITDRSGRTLSGQTTEAFWNSVRHARPFSIGLNCALGPEDLRQYIADMGAVADCLVTAHPNAGLPNAFGGYDETPRAMAAHIGEWARSGLVNVVGGCCGTTPEHIGAIAKAIDGVAPRALPVISRRMRLSGLEPFELPA